MKVPIPFQGALAQMKQRLGPKTSVTKASWTTPLKRHFGVTLEAPSGLHFAKLALARQRDFNEPNMREGLCREVWWSQVIHGLADRGYKLPFTSPRITEHNTDDENAEAVWTVAEYLDGKPMLEWESAWTSQPLSVPQQQAFEAFVDTTTSTLFALEQIQVEVLNDFGLPPLPSLPHASRYYERRGLLNKKKSILGNGAFDVEHFWRTRDGKVVLIDAEFAGWYPRYDHLMYLYHRLFCNLACPKLAKFMLKHYISTAFRDEKSLEEFVTAFKKLLRPYIVIGWHRDLTRRRVMPWHHKQCLRYKLLWTVCCGRCQRLWE